MQTILLGNAAEDMKTGTSSLRRAAAASSQSCLRQHGLQAHPAPHTDGRALWPKAVRISALETTLGNHFLL